MAAEKPNLIRIAVTGGDALPDNRVKGKSNTGTYFLCSEQDWETFKPFFKKGVEHFFDTTRIRAYCASFLEVFKNNAEAYPDRFASIADYGKFFSTGVLEKPTQVDLRINPPRIFMRFKDNSDPDVDAFRHLLYAPISSIVMELKEGKCLIYPDINPLGQIPLPDESENEEEYFYEVKE